MSEAKATSPLRHAELRRIVAGYTVNRLGTWFGFIAMAVVVFDHTHSAIAVASLLIASQVLPALIVPALVARVETSTRRGELTRLYLFEAATTGALIALVLWHFSLPAILLLVALDGTAALAASALLRAAAARSARDWVRTSQAPGTQGASIDELSAAAERRANAALNIGFAVTFTLGPALAGVVVPTLGASAALAIDMVSFAICGALLVIGLFTRLATLPLIVSMIVAILTAKLGDIHDVFDLVGADEFTYLCVLVILAIIGPGALSIDHLLVRRVLGSNTQDKG